MSRYGETFAVSLVAASILLYSAPSVALGPDTGKGVLSSPLGSGAGKPAPTKMLPAAPLQRGAPMTAPTPQVAAPPASGTPAALPVEPKWPQGFELGTGERTGFGFVAGKPGPIVVSVKWQGAPLVVSLGKPGGGTVERQGSGSVTIEYTATVEDVKKGTLWMVGLRSAQGAASPSGGPGIQVLDKPVKLQPQVVAKGTVSVQHPPGDMQRAQAELKARADQMAARSKLQPAAAPQANVATQKQAALQKQQSARQAQLLEQVKLKIPVEAYQKMSRQIASPATSPATAASGVSVPMKQPRAAIDRTGIKALPPQGISQTQSADVGVVGSNPPQTIASPVIASLSLSSGQPGDPVLITGSGFADTPGEVRIVVGPNPQQDLSAVISSWSDTQVFVTVPDVSGVTGFNGLVYVKRGNVASNKVPFHFNPGLEIRVIDHTTSDRSIRTPYTIDSQICHPACAYGFNLGFLMFGGKSEDEYYRNTTLKNGWVVDSAYLAHLQWQSGVPVDLLGPSSTSNANAYITEVRAGTNSPYVKVHWWYDAGGNSTGYVLRVVIRGPKGVSYK